MQNKMECKQNFSSKIEIPSARFVPLITFNIRSILYPLYHYISDMLFLLRSIKYPTKVYLKCRVFMAF